MKKPLFEDECFLKFIENKSICQFLLIQEISSFFKSLVNNVISLILFNFLLINDNFT